MLRPALLVPLVLSACGGAPGATAGGSGSESETGASTTTTSEAPTGGKTTSSGTTSSGTTSSGTTSSGTTSSTTASSTVTTEAPTTTAATTGDTTTGAEASGPRYHEVRQKSSHNAFQRHEALFDQIVYHRIRSLELDIHTGKAFEAALAGDWFVYHTDVIDDDTHCRTLSQCLDQVAAFARAVPAHEVVTLWIDLKDGFGGGHQPDDLDALLAAAFADALVRPEELLAACPGATTLQEAVTTRGCTWPRLEAWRGRVIAMLTGGDLDDPSGPLATYVGADAGARAAFVAPGLSDAQDLFKHSAAIVHNLEIGDVTVAEAVRAAGMVSRVWVADDEGAWAAAEQAGVHHIATNQINRDEDPWANTAGPQGWPFTCIADCEAPASESAAIVTVTVDSGDLWGGSDEGLFAGALAGAGEVVWTAAIAAPNSHVEPWAKACLAARAGLQADAAYLAICRPADDHPLRVQRRETAGAGTEAFEFAGVPGLTGESPAFVRLERLADASCVRGLGSSDGVGWTAIAEHCFSEPLTHVGLAAASHGAGPLPLLFVAPTATPGGPVAAADLTVTPLGAGVGGVADGW
ncbi:Phosphoinositide phospholipase C, Ca2+-dependent [Nannocystis exedens]|uniref:Phosphoinositide phospholipase C, Ca2+-dependent n=1 Tax=Nannocystis exedens TaxID=54 RepID=A0A1I2DDY3_9BACT|nr:Ca2+-dependent phosphoinositide-specific phospholipase C [Nannocystis exedens]PCC70595.1 hypothetical protein NAEX_03659 [Nannocystis exedens]SFE78160.1 Phosphoinositide phospholipase C, Ca2+-dependent [Nannocystis exedens]